MHLLMPLFHIEEKNQHHSTKDLHLTKYIIYDLGGIKEFPNDLESCKSLKNTIVESFEPSAKNFKYQEYEYFLTLLSHH